MKTRSAHTILQALAYDIMMKNMLSVRPSQSILSGNDKKGKVGEVIRKLPRAERKALRKLTSKDAGNIRLWK